MDGSGEEFSLRVTQERMKWTECQLPSVIRIKSRLLSLSWDLYGVDPDQSLAVILVDDRGAKLERTTDGGGPYLPGKGSPRTTGLIAVGMKKS